ncbi:AHH domain-containing protein [Xanthomonas sp. D-99]|uniref:AHH domain-containing protein n=1 Tax=Xanthomonas sp. D-99 TaxID=2821273 RepID=UPI001FD32A04|nr:AHH domain-containing protein [Xanthomonas sp. D-99]
MSNYRTHFQDHHNIEQQTLKNSELLDLLQRAGKFDIHAPENRLMLPADPQFARALDITR